MGTGSEEPNHVCLTGTICRCRYALHIKKEVEEDYSDMPPLEEATNLRFEFNVDKSREFADKRHLDEIERLIKRRWSHHEVLYTAPNIARRQNVLGALKNAGYTVTIRHDGEIKISGW